MRKILITCCFILGITALSYAQNGRRFNPEDRAKQLQTQLKLNDDQTTKVTALYKEQRTQLDSLRKVGTAREQMMPLMQSTNEKIKAILTPDQVTTFERLQAERIQRIKAFRDKSGNE